ncbi:MAG: VOC family protein [Thermomicrobiales bacterium]
MGTRSTCPTPAGRSTGRVVPAQEARIASAFSVLDADDQRELGRLLRTVSAPSAVRAQESADVIHRKGFHHATLFRATPRERQRFIADLLGFQLVKKTVNFDLPTTYHLYFGKGRRAGTLITYFEWPHASGEHGVLAACITSRLAPRTAIRCCSGSGG